MKVVDVALLVIYLFVFVYFMKRLVRFRKWPSLFIALLPMGWVVLALEDSMQDDLQRTITVVKWTGFAMGFLLMMAVTHADRTGPDHQ